MICAAPYTNLCLTLAMTLSLTFFTLSRAESIQCDNGECDNSELDRGYEAGCLERTESLPRAGRDRLVYCQDTPGLVNCSGRGVTFRARIQALNAIMARSIGVTRRNPAHQSVPGSLSDSLPESL